jgi:hypothetical protein
MDFLKGVELGDYFIINDGWKGRDEKYLVVHYFKSKVYFMSLENAFFNDLFSIEVPKEMRKHIKIKESIKSPTKGFMPSYKGEKYLKNSCIRLQKKVKDPKKEQSLQTNEAVGLGYRYAIKCEYNEKYNVKEFKGIALIYDEKNDRPNIRNDYNSYTGYYDIYFLMDPKFQSDKNMTIFDGDEKKARKKGFTGNISFWTGTNNRKGTRGNLDSAVSSYKREVLDAWEDEEFGEVKIIKEWEKYITDIRLA